jgi:hypothetical protein
MENILGAMDQVTAALLKDWMFTPDQMELPSMESKIGVWFLMILGRVSWVSDNAVLGCEDSRKHHHIVQKGAEDATKHLGGEGTFW